MSVMRFLISGLALAAAQSASAGAQEVIIFEHNNYQGRSVRLTADAPNLDRRGFNDRASSIRVVSGTWEFCQHANFGGSCYSSSAGCTSTMSRRATPPPAAAPVLARAPGALPRPRPRRPSRAARCEYSTRAPGIASGWARRTPC